MPRLRARSCHNLAVPSAQYYRSSSPSPPLLPQLPRRPDTRQARSRRCLSAPPAALEAQEAARWLPERQLEPPDRGRAARRNAALATPRTAPEQPVRLASEPARVRRALRPRAPADPAAEQRAVATSAAGPRRRAACGHARCRAAWLAGSRNTPRAAARRLVIRSAEPVSIACCQHALASRRPHGSTPAAKPLRLERCRQQPSTSIDVLHCRPRFAASLPPSPAVDQPAETGWLWLVAGSCRLASTRWPAWQVVPRVIHGLH